MNDKETIKALNDGKVIFRFYDDFSEDDYYTLLGFFKLSIRDKVLISECYRAVFNKATNMSILRYFIFLDNSMGIIQINNVEEDDVIKLDPIIHKSSCITENMSKPDILKFIFSEIPQDLVIKYWEDTSIIFENEPEFKDKLNELGKIKYFKSYESFLESDSLYEEIDDEDESNSYPSNPVSYESAMSSLLNGGISTVVEKSTGIISAYIMYKRSSLNIAYLLYQSIPTNSDRYVKIAFFIPKFKEGKIVDFKAIVNDKFYKRESYEDYSNNFDKLKDKIINLNYEEFPNDELLKSELISVFNDDYKSRYGELFKVMNIVDAVSKGFILSTCPINN